MRPVALLILLFALPTAGAETGLDPSPEASDASPLSEALLRSRARPLERTPPRYPRVALERMAEGWVDVSFVVEPDGSVSDPVVEASSGDWAFEQAALRAVQGWKYQPALQNGEPIRQCETRVRMTFALEKDRQGARSTFIRRYRQIERMLEGGKADEALAAAINLLDNVAQNLYEVSRAWFLRVRVEQQAGASAETLLRSVRRAAASRAALGDDQLYRALLEAQLSLELDLAQYQRAMHSASRLTSLLEDIGGGDEAIDNVISDLVALRNGSGYLSVAGRIDEQSLLDEQPALWTHQPLRRKFGIQDVEGEISVVDLRCDWHRLTTGWIPDVAFQLPEDWGTCDVYVYGKPGTTFQLIEYPLEGG